MYKELIKRLREKAGAFDYDGRPDIACDYEQAADAIEELKKFYKIMADAYETEVTRQDWIPVTKRLPDNIDEEVLVCNEGYGKDGTGFATVAVYNGNGWLECWEMKQYLACITHWMPLPKPPKEET